MASFRIHIILSEEIIKKLKEFLIQGVFHDSLICFCEITFHVVMDPNSDDLSRDF